MMPAQRLEVVQTPVVAKIAALTRKTPDTVSLGQGIVNYGPPASVFKRLAEFGNGPFPNAYGPVVGLPELHERIHEKLKNDNNIHLSDETQLIVTAGSNMGFLQAIMALADLGDEIILLKPFYFNHEMAITMLGCNVVAVDTNSEFQPDIAKIKQAITHKTRAIVTISPNNPTGAVYSKHTLSEINQLCAAKGIYHISDEAYEYFTFDQTSHFSPASLSGANKHTISLFSLSKAYGFASWRIGYMLVPKQLAEGIIKIQDTNLICASHVSQIAATECLKVGRSYCDKRLRQIELIRQKFFQELDKLSGLSDFIRTNGAFYILLRVATELDSYTLAERLISEFKVATLPGESFGLNDGSYLRISYAALDEKTAATGIQRLITGLASLKSAE